MASNLQNSASRDPLVPATTKVNSPHIAVVGLAGYAGGELARILLRHPRVAQQNLSFFSRAEHVANSPSRSLAEFHPHLLAEGAPRIRSFCWTDLERDGVEILFLAIPHEQSRIWVPEAIKRNIKAIDLSGAWRLKEPENRSVYGFAEENSGIAEALQTEAVYGSPELHKDAVSTARLVANPGCYATSIILALAPLIRGGLVDVDQGIVCDAKSGVSGAGKTPSANTHFMHVADNLSAYSVFGHRHTGELLEQLDLSDSDIQFTPHLLPIPRGILSTIYLRLVRELREEAVIEVMRSFYRDCPFVRIRPSGRLPEIQHVVRTNFCDIGVALQCGTRRLVLVSCLDNLLKGAAGQAVQNMNLMLGWGETEGLL